jgi:hypothetical protein
LGYLFLWNMLEPAKKEILRKNEKGINPFSDHPRIFRQIPW